MGLKNKLNKMKSFLFDEEDDEKEVKKVKNPFKKEVKKAKIEDEDFSETDEIERLYFEDEAPEPKNEEITEIKSRVSKTEQEFKFPEFDDEDFMVAKTKPEPIINSIKQEAKPVLYQGSKRKEETKKFKPSPRISPIYGLLDDEGNTVNRESGKSEINKNNDEVSFDSVRKKAYGIIDEELENTMKKLSSKTIEEAEKEMEEQENELSRSKEKAKKVNDEKPIIIKNDEDEEDDMILPNVNFKEIDVEKEITKDFKEDLIVAKNESKDNYDEEDDEDTKEQDLFNLIDSIYQKEGRED